MITLIRTDTYYMERTILHRFIEHFNIHELPLRYITIKFHNQSTLSFTA